MKSVAFSYLSEMRTHRTVVLITSEGDNVYLITKLMPTADREDTMANQLFVILRCIFKSIV